jgi:hypothetical protein
MEAHQSFCKDSLHIGRGLGDMKNITAQKKQVGLDLRHERPHLFKHRALFFSAVVTVYGMAEMPVACMDYLHVVSSCKFPAKLPQISGFTNTTTCILRAP